MELSHNSERRADAGHGGVISCLPAAAEFPVQHPLVLG